MRTLKRRWAELSFEKKLSIVVAPLLLVLVAGVLVPWLNRIITPDEPPQVLRATLRNVDVETGVTLATYSARRRSAASTPSGSAAGHAHIEIGSTTFMLAAATATTESAQKEPPKATQTGPTNDRDGDGVPNATDSCPDKAAKTPRWLPTDDQR